MIYHIILFMDILLGAVAQVLMKIGMQRHGKPNTQLKTLHKEVIRMYLGKYVFMGIILYSMSFLIWLFVISKIDLSYAYPLVSMNFVLIAVFSKIFFRENVSRKRWLSIALILVGVILVTLS